MHTAETITATIQRLLREKSDVATLRACAEAYAQACEEVNQRLAHCVALLRQEQIPEALAAARVEPKVLHTFSTLQFPEMHDWRSLLQSHKIPAPPALRGDLAAKLQAAITQHEPQPPKLLTTPPVLKLRSLPRHKQNWVMGAIGGIALLLIALVMLILNKIAVREFAAPQPKVHAPPTLSELEPAAEVAPLELRLPTGETNEKSNQDETDPFAPRTVIPAEAADLFAAPTLNPAVEENSFSRSRLDPEWNEKGSTNAPVPQNSPENKSPFGFGDFANKKPSIPQTTKSSVAEKSPKSAGSAFSNQKPSFELPAVMEGSIPFIADNASLIGVDQSKLYAPVVLLTLPIGFQVKSLDLVGANASLEKISSTNAPEWKLADEGNLKLLPKGDLTQLVFEWSSGANPKEEMLQYSALKIVNQFDDSYWVALYAPKQRPAVKIPVTRGMASSTAFLNKGYELKMGIQQVEGFDVELPSISTKQEQDVEILSCAHVKTDRLALKAKMTVESMSAGTRSINCELEYTVPDRSNSNRFYFSPEIWEVKGFEEYESLFVQKTKYADQLHTAEQRLAETISESGKVSWRAAIEEINSNISRIAEKMATLRTKYPLLKKISILSDETVFPIAQKLAVKWASRPGETVNVHLTVYRVVTDASAEPPVKLAIPYIQFGDRPSRVLSLAE